MWWRSRLLRVIFSLVLLALRTYQLQSYERQVLLQLRKHLEYPIQLDVWLNYNGDLCNLSSTARTSIACQGNSVTELKIMGDKLAKFSEFNGFALPNQTLSESLSMDSFVTTLTRLTNLRVLSLVSLGIWGPLPDKIHRLYSLELLDMSLNFMFGTIPSQISRMVSLHTLTLDGNFFNDTMPDWLCSLANLTVLSLRDNRKRHTRCAPPDLHTLPKVVQDIPPSAISSELLANARIISHAAKLGTQGTLVYRLFTMEELEEATKHFDPSMLLGDGSIGKIYKGRLENGSYVAIRSLSLHKKFLIRNLKLRLDLLSKFCHPHLVCLLGHCIDGGVQDDSTVNRVFLVYEFVPDGNFHARLSETCPEKFLKWSDRLAVLIGVAKAVHFLHTGVIPPSACNRLKTKNILLDEHRVAKLSDYGMSILTEEVEKSEAKGDVSKSW